MARTDYDTGIGILADSRLEVRNAGFRRFAAKVGVNDTGQPGAGTIIFEVWGDGRLLARSRPKAFGESAEPLTADTNGVRILELVARGAGGQQGMPPQPATWADAALLR